MVLLCAGLKADRAQFPDVSRALEKVATDRGLQLHQNWLNKCIQLYETYLVSSVRPQSG
jgi:dynein heavy chain